MELERDGTVDDYLGEAFKCNSCGAPLVYKPGTNSMLCEHCGSTESIVNLETKFVVQNYEDFIKGYKPEYFQESKVVECTNCHATATVDENLKTMRCPYCDVPLIETMVHSERSVKPKYLTPFQIPKNRVPSILKGWADKLWFAPNKIKRAILEPQSLRGIYAPYWLYNADTRTKYSGLRGDYYTVVVGSGKNRRTETRIRWSNRSGMVQNSYRSLLQQGTTSVDQMTLKNIGHWDLTKLVGYNPSYLSGFITEKYKIDIQKAFEKAKEQIKNEEKISVNRDIGGNVQKITAMHTEYDNVEFSHILLPFYISSFIYGNKSYKFFINGQTGTITGDRPYSAWKITFAVLIALIILGGLYLWYQLSQ